MPSPGAEGKPQVQALGAGLAGQGCAAAALQLIPIRTRAMGGRAYVGELLPYSWLCVSAWLGQGRCRGLLGS